MHAQSCPTVCDPMDCRLPGSSVHGIFQERILQWVAISYSRGSSQPRNWTCVSCIGRRIFYQYATWDSLWKQNQDTIPSERALSWRPVHAKLIENGSERNVAVSGTSLVVQWLTLLSQCRGHRFDPWLGNWGLTWLMVGPKEKKKTYSSMKGVSSLDLHSALAKSCSGHFDASILWVHLPIHMRHWQTSVTHHPAFLMFYTVSV